jgi:hypothetical protein
VIISPATLSTPVGHPLGEGIFYEKDFVLMPANQKSPFLEYSN